MATLAALETATPHALLRLPYPEDALAPIISARTVGFHHGKHHKGYVDKVNELVAGTEFEGQALERIVMATSGKPDKTDRPGITPSTGVRSSPRAGASLAVRSPTGSRRNSAVSTPSRRNSSPPR